MDNCKFCKALNGVKKLEGDLCAVVDLDGTLVVIYKEHVSDVNQEVFHEMSRLVNELGLKGYLTEYCEIGHWGAAFTSDVIGTQAKTR